MTATTTTVKSITPVNTTAGWAARQRNANGAELYVLAERSAYTLAQAGVACDSLRRHLAGGGTTYAVPLPDGVREVRS